ncbi:uncharacterized protein LOC125187637 isoform X2 [Salvia hispanica]|uniref:uncharacterized protein LOC125187637 isoform X2 n=1 Tax=Salvia hispanica TaxID=49212 RepID=UPI0020095F2E|nr:uncharacterized protein LOC125187637 isoform X2 [Salvia hispanica]
MSSSFLKLEKWGESNFAAIWVSSKNVLKPLLKLEKRKATMQSGHQHGKGVSNSMNCPSGDSSKSFGVDGLSETRRNKFRKGERSRRMWTAREEEILAASLLELTATGWKADNGFRAGYLSKIEDSLRAEFPNTDLKGNPHINSKMQAWKKSYGSLRLILGRSGVGFNNHGDYKIDCSDDQWD